jgi:hypothetical protein
MARLSLRGSRNGSAWELAFRARTDTCRVIVERQDARRHTIMSTGTRRTPSATIGDESYRKSRSESEAGNQCDTDLRQRDGGDEGRPEHAQPTDAGNPDVGHVDEVRGHRFERRSHDDTG